MAHRELSSESTQEVNELEEPERSLDLATKNFYALIKRKVIEDFVILTTGGRIMLSRPNTDLEKEMQANVQLVNKLSQAFSCIELDLDKSSSQSSSYLHSFDLLSKRFVVIRRTLNSFCAVTRNRSEGVIIHNLPARMILVCTFCRPNLPQIVVPEVEKACELICK